jgi:hypothetical protein
MKTFYISEKHFTHTEIETFKAQHNYNIKDIEYVSLIEIDFSQKEEKDFLLKKGYPKILARFFT